MIVVPTSTQLIMRRCDNLLCEKQNPERLLDGLCFNGHLMNLISDGQSCSTHTGHTLRPGVINFTWGRCRWPCPEPGDRRPCGSALQLWTRAARQAPSSEGCSCCHRQSPCKETPSANRGKAWQFIWQFNTTLWVTRIPGPVGLWGEICHHSKKNVPPQYVGF